MPEPEEDALTELEKEMDGSPYFIITIDEDGNLCPDTNMDFAQAIGNLQMVLDAYRQGALEGWDE